MRVCLRVSKGSQQRERGRLNTIPRQLEPNMCVQSTRSGVITAVGSRDALLVGGVIQGPTTVGGPVLETAMG
jgi:hypothetical protein